MVLTSDFIRVYDNVLDADVCDALMHIFDITKTNTKDLMSKRDHPSLNII